MSKFKTKRQKSWDYAYNYALKHPKEIEKAYKIKSPKYYNNPKNGMMGDDEESIKFRASKFADMIEDQHVSSFYSAGYAKSYIKAELAGMRGEDQTLFKARAMDCVKVQERHLFGERRGFHKKIGEFELEDLNFDDKLGENEEAVGKWKIKNTLYSLVQIRQNGNANSPTIVYRYLMEN